MQYDLLYNHISYLRGMIYLTNKIEIKMIKLIKRRKTRSVVRRKKNNVGSQTRQKPEAVLEGKLCATKEAT